MSRSSADVQVSVSDVVQDFRGTAEDYAELHAQLQINANGHAHVANKAQYYLREVEKKPNAKVTNCLIADFILAIRGAVYRGKWEALDTFMAGWW